MSAYGNDSVVPGFDEEKGDHLNIFLERIEGDEQGLTVHLGDRIDTYNTDYFERSVGKLLSAGYKRLLFDCRELGYVSASGMAAFSRIAHDLRAKGGAMAFAKMQSRVYDIFDMLGLASVHIIRDDPARALAELKNLPPPQPKVFRLSFACPGCGRKLVANKAGKFVCSSCRTRIIVDEKGLARAC